MKQNRITILDINKEMFENKLSNLDANKISDTIEKASSYIVDGEELILSSNEIKYNNKKTEINSYDNIALILEKLGAKKSKSKEFKKTLYNLDNVKISFESWPLIPRFASLEGNEEEVRNIFQKLNM
ncbi:MAG: hypothetical protein RSA91_06170, partial [Bacilli bacterium]